MVAAFVRTIFAQPDADAARRQLREVATRLKRSLPKAAGVLADAEDDVTAYTVFPRHHWRKIRSTNPLERVNKEINRRTNVVGAILAEQHDEWQTSARRYLTMNRAVILDLEQPIMLELEAAKHESHRRGSRRNTPLDGTLPRAPVSAPARPALASRRRLSRLRRGRCSSTDCAAMEREAPN